MLLVLIVLQTLILLSQDARAVCSNNECDQNCSPYGDVSQVGDRWSQRVLKVPSPIPGASPNAELSSYCGTYFSTEDGAGWQFANIGIDAVAAGVCLYSCINFLESFTSPSTILSLAMGRGNAKGNAAFGPCAKAVIAADVAELAAVAGMNSALLSGQSGSSGEIAGAWFSLLGSAATVASGGSTMLSAMAAGAGTGLKGVNQMINGNQGGGALQSNQAGTASPNPLQAQLLAEQSHANDALMAGKSMIGIGTLYALKNGKNKNLLGLNACFASGLYATIAGMRSYGMYQSCGIKSEACGTIKRLSWGGSPARRYYSKVIQKELNFLPEALAAEAGLRSGAQFNRAFGVCAESSDSCFTSSSDYRNSMDGRTILESGLDSYVFPVAQRIDLDSMSAGADAGSLFHAIATQAGEVLFASESPSASNLKRRTDFMSWMSELSSLAEYGSNHPGAPGAMSGIESGTARPVLSNANDIVKIEEEKRILKYVGGLPWSAFGARETVTKQPMTRQNPIWHANSDINIFQIISFRLSGTCKLRLANMNCPKY